MSRNPLMPMSPAAAALAAAVLLVLQGCASAPKAETRGIASTQPMETLRDEAFAQSERFIDAEAVLATTRVGVPTVRIVDDAFPDSISPQQAALVANRAARDVCNGLARYVTLDPEISDPSVEIVVTSIRPTSAGAAGASAVLGVFVPGPFRLPAGLGGFAADGALRKAGEAVYVLHWAEGAGAITEDARVSAIGDAYQLANDFADEFIDGFSDPKEAASPDRTRVDAATRDANQALCLARFGRANPVGRGATILLPLAPEAFDAGAPEASGLEATGVDADERVERTDADDRGE